MTRGTDHRVDPWQVPEVEALASLRRRAAGRYGLRHVVVLVVLAALSLGGAVPTLFSALPAVVLAGAALATRILTGVTCR